MGRATKQALRCNTPWVYNNPICVFHMHSHHSPFSSEISEHTGGTGFGPWPEKPILVPKCNVPGFLHRTRNMTINLDNLRSGDDTDIG